MSGKGNGNMIVLGIILALVGVLLIAAVINSKGKCTMRVEATVSSLIVKAMPRRGYTVDYYTPIFTYTVDGKEYSTKADLFTKDKKLFAVGQKATVLVNPADPAMMRYGSTAGFLITGIVLALAGLFFLVLCFF